MVLATNKGNIESVGIFTNIKSTMVRHSKLKYLYLRTERMHPVSTVATYAMHVSVSNSTVVPGLSMVVFATERIPSPMMW
jgi:hypothetical protein